MAQLFRPKGLFVLDPASYPMIYGEEDREEIGRHVDLVGPAQTRLSILDNTKLLRDVQFLFTGWGAPVLDQAFLDLCPRLRIVFYGAGSAAGMLTQEVWNREIVVTTAYAANAVPVAEYTLATILFSLKHGWALTHRTRADRRYPDRNGAPGCYGTTVGLISLGMIARTLLRLLKPFNLRVLVADPFLSVEEAESLGVELVSLETLFASADVVSLHTPLLAETHGLITGAHFSSMKQGASFINTARGMVVREQEMIALLDARPDLHAVLDVTNEEPPRMESRLYDMPNVTLTPHMAGSVGKECQRMGRYMVEELKRYLTGEPLKWVVTPELARRSSHRPAVSVSVAKPLRKAEASESALLS